MPKRTPEYVVAYIAKLLTLHPSVSYPEVVRRVELKFGVKLSIEGVKKIAIRECPKLDPKWKKINPLLQEYRCQFRLASGRRHLKKFSGHRGYSGESAVYCEEHRTGKTAA